VENFLLHARNRLIAGVASRPFLLAVVTLFLSGCGGDYAVDLPNGYRLVRTNASSIQIFWPENFSGHAYSGLAVPPKIVAIGSTEKLVYGIVETSPHSENAHLTVPGYFVLDTSNGNAVLGLDEQGFKEKLKQLGIASTPSLTSNIRGFRCFNAMTPD
jgi:hypothetical protein